MSITGNFQVIVGALSDGFSEKSLREMLRPRLNVHLDTISVTGSLRNQVFDLVSWAERRGLLQELVRAAYRFNPRYPALAEVYARMGMSPEVVVNPRLPADFAAGAPRVAATRPPPLTAASP